jgi:hypothetical protein
MAPKPPKISAPNPHTPERPMPEVPRLPRDDLPLPPRIGAPGTDLPTLPPGTSPTVDAQTGIQPSTPIGGPSIHIRDGSVVPPTVLPEIDPLKLYRVSPHSRRTLPAPNNEGLRIYARRQFVDLDDATTVQVDWDEAAGAFRAKRPNELNPSGPTLYLNDDRKTWSPGLPEITTGAAGSTRRRPSDDVSGSPGAAKRPRLDPDQPDAAPAYINTDHYVWNEHANNHHGYVVMHRKRGLSDVVGPPSHYAFRDDNGLFVGVAPSVMRINQPALQLPAWTDHNLWDFYGIHGSAITRFRNEAHSTGKKPQWAKPRAQRLEKAYLYEELHRWISPDVPRETFVKVLEASNRTPQQLASMLDKVDLYRNKPRPALPGSTQVPRESTANVPRPAAQQPSGANASAPVFGDHGHYIFDPRMTTRQGYVVMHRKPGLDNSHGPETQLAFVEGKRLINVQPPEYSINQEASLRQYWSDYEIWNLYRIEGKDLLRFRQDVALHGKPPQWVRPREYPSLREQLIDHLRLWTSGPMRTLESKANLIARLRPYNFSAQQLSRLCSEVTATGEFSHRLNDDLPTWAEAHKRTTLNEGDTQRFAPFLAEFQAEILSLRNKGFAPGSLKNYLTPAFFNSLLSHVGYKRNKHNCLFSSDIPAMFRADDRTPFELARSDAMLPRMTLGEGTTTLTAVSATFSLKDAANYAERVDSEALAYDTQQDGHAANQDDSDGDLDFELDLPSAQVPKRQAQTFAFYYLLDTRNVEVVPARENYAFNKDALDNKQPGSKTWFPDDDLEGHISMSDRGFIANRIWLVNSTLTRAAKVNDVYAQSLGSGGIWTGSDGEAIEASTWAGQSNRHEYDALIDQVAASGKTVLDFPANLDVFSNDIVFAPDTTRPNAV